MLNEKNTLRYGKLHISFFGAL